MKYKLFIITLMILSLTILVNAQDVTVTVDDGTGTFNVRNDKPDTLMVVDGKTGNVGIGIINPQERLHIHGDLLAIDLTNNHRGANIMAADEDSNIVNLFVQDTVGYLKTTNDAMDLVLGAGFWGDHLTIKSDGNVGIGTTSPTEKLQVAGNMRLDGTFEDKDGDTGTAGQILSSTATGTNWIAISSGADNLGDHTATQNINLNSKWLSGDGDEEGVFVDSDGNIGIGTATPDADRKLHVVGDGKITGDLHVGGSITPEIHRSQDMGSDTTAWGTIYAKSFEVIGSSVKFFHDGTDAHLVTDTGNFHLENNTSNHDINLVIKATGGQDAHFVTDRGGAEHIIISDDGDKIIFMEDVDEDLHFWENDNLHRKVHIHGSVEAIDGMQVGDDGTDGQLTIYSEQGVTDYSIVLQPNAAMTENTTYTFPADDGNVGQILSTDAAGGLSWESLPGGADNLGDHTAKQNIQLGAFALSGDGDDEGIYVDTDGNIEVSGTVDGIDIATDVAANTAKVTDDDDGVDEVYGAGWDADTDAPTKNNVYDKIESLPAGSDDQKVDVFSISGNNVQLSVEDDGEATKTVDISTTTAVAANTAKVTDDDDGVAEVYGAGWDGDGESPTKNNVYDKIESLPAAHDAVTLNANAIAAGLSLSNQEINYRAATNAQTGYMTATLVGNIETNNAKVTNVPTALSVGTVGVGTVAITSDGGTDDVTLPAATATTAGMLTTAKWGEIVANTAKVTNTDDQKIDVFSGAGNTISISLEDDGEANQTLDISGFTAIAANTAKVTNATHTGDVTGSGALAIGAGKVTEAMQILADNVTQDVSITKHGYVPKGTNTGTDFLRDDGTWATPVGGGDVVKVGTPVNDQVGVWTGDGTIEGDADLTFDGTDLTTTGAINFVGGSAGDGNLTNLGRVEADVIAAADDIMLTVEDSTNFSDDVNIAGSLGIGTTSPTAKLQVAGNMRLDGTFEDKDGNPGTAGQILSSTVTGTDWISTTSTPIYFGASGATGTTSGSTPLKIPFSTSQVIDPSSGFSDANDWYVIPEDGDYLISGGCDQINDGDGSRWSMYIYRNGTTIISEGYTNPLNSDEHSITIAPEMISLVTGDTIHLAGRVVGTASGFRFTSCRFTVVKL